MENFNPMILVNAITGLIAIVGAFASLAYTFAVIRTEVNGLKERESIFISHMNNDAKHHNGEAFKEFEKRIEKELANLNEGVKDVKEYCEHIDGKLDKLKNTRTKQGE